LAKHVYSWFGGFPFINPSFSCSAMSSASCSEVANSLIDCIKKSQCYKSLSPALAAQAGGVGDGTKTVRNCIKIMKTSAFGDNEQEERCQVLRGAYFDCKRNQLDMRKRIRGNASY